MLRTEPYTVPLNGLRGDLVHTVCDYLHEACCGWIPKTETGQLMCWISWDMIYEWRC